MWQVERTAIPKNKCVEPRLGANGEQRSWGNETCGRNPTDSYQSSSPTPPYSAMTSHLINAFVNKAEKISSSHGLKDDALSEDCSFCAIIHGKQPAFRLFEDDSVIAILGQFT